MKHGNDSCCKARDLCAAAAHRDYATHFPLLVSPQFSLRPSRCCRSGRAGAAALPSEVRQAQGGVASGLCWHGVSGCVFGILIMRQKIERPCSLPLSEDLVG